MKNSKLNGNIIIPIEKNEQFLHTLEKFYNDEELSVDEYNSISDFVEDKQGINFIYGPTHSGKTEYLNSKLDQLVLDENAKILISYFEDSSKIVKEKLISLFEDEIEFYPLVKEKLSSKKQGEREVAIRILDSFKNSKECSEETKNSIIEELTNVLEKEKSQKIRTLLMKTLNLEEANNETLSDESFIKNILKGNRKSSLSWIGLENLCKVKMKDSEEYCSDEYLNALLLCY